MNCHPGGAHFAPRDLTMAGSIGVDGKNIGGAGSIDVLIYSISAS